MVVNNQITAEYASQPVVIVGYDNPSNMAQQRKTRYYAADPTSPGTLPHLMVDSGRQTLRGGNRDQAYYVQKIKSMIDSELGRPPQAAISAQYRRVGSHFEFTINVTNQSGVTLSAAQNDAMVHAVVYETFTNATRPSYSLVNNFGRVTAYKYIGQPLANGATGTYTLITTDLANVVDWNNLHMLVMVDYRPGGTTGPFDMLQAAFAQPEIVYSLSPTQLSFLVDQAAPADQTAQIQVNTNSTTLTWSASESVPWMAVSPGPEVASKPISVDVTAANLNPGIQKGTITIQLNDAGGFSQTEQVPVSAFLGSIRRFYIPYLRR